MGNIHKGRSPNSLFTKIPNQLIRNTNISDNTFRFICWVSSHNDGFKVSFASIKSSLGYGRDKLRSIIAEAETNNYLVRTSFKNSKGRFDWDYFVFADIDECIDFQRSLPPEVGQPKVDKPGVGKPPTDEPPTGQPSTGQTTDGRNPPHKKNNLKEDQFKEDQSQEEVGEENKTQNQEEEIKSGEPKYKLASLDNKPTHLAKADNPSLRSVIPSASSDNLEQLNFRDQQFCNPRPLNIMKGTSKSNSSDPWMVSNSNPCPEFSQWVFNLRYKGQVGKTLADAKSEIRNDCDRASDLWDEYQKEVSSNRSTSMEWAEADDNCGIDFRGMDESQHAIIFNRDYLRSSSTEEFYKKCDWYKSWHKYAKAAYPGWAWNTIK